MTRWLSARRAESLGVVATSFPGVWMPTQVQHREHCNQIRLGREEHPVWKITHQAAPNLLLDDGKLKRIRQDSGEDRIDLCLKAEAEALTLALVSKCRLEDLELGLGRDVEPPHLANGAESGQQLLADLRPRARGHLAASICRKTLGNHLAMPVRDWDIFGMLGEMVPKRLNVFELLVRRELVEARRRKRRLRHDSSIPASVTLANPLHATTTNWRQERRTAIHTIASTRATQGLPPQFHIIYVGVNAVRPRAASRCRAAIGAVRHLFLDVDANAQAVLHAIAEHADLPSPSYVMHTSLPTYPGIVAGDGVHESRRRSLAKAPGA